MTVYTPDISSYTLGSPPPGWNVRRSTLGSGETTADVVAVANPVSDRAMRFDPAATAHRVAELTGSESGGRVDVLICARRLTDVTGRDAGIVARCGGVTGITYRLTTLASDELHAARISQDNFAFTTNAPVSITQPAAGTWWWMRAQFEGTTVRTSWSLDLDDLLAVDVDGTPDIGWQIVGTISLSGTESDANPVGVYCRAEDPVEYAYFSAGTNGDLAVEPTLDPPSPPWSLDLSTVGSGTVDVEDDGVPVDPDTYEWDDESAADLTATPDSGWVVADPLWTGAGVPSGQENANPLSVTMDGDKTIVANFEEDPEPPAPAFEGLDITITSPTSATLTWDPHGTGGDWQPSLEARGRWCPPDPEAP